MSEQRRMSSIARRMGRSWMRRLFSTFVFIDLAVLLLAILGYCYALEMGSFGDITGNLRRSFHADWSSNLRVLIDSAQYMVEDVSGAVHSFALGDFLRVLVAMLSALCLIELLALVYQSGSAKRTANRLLRPLLQMTRTAQRLSQENFDEARFESLEHAIESISPNAPEARLRTGDRELKGLEGAINDLVARMHESYKEQNRFVSDASHELRTPIAVIQGYSSMLERWGKNDEKILDESIAAIKTEAEHMNKLVEQLLFLARGDSGRTDLTLEPFDLNEMIREVYEEYQMIDQRHEYEFSGESGATCTADQAMIKQVARVLTDNAIKYTPSGGRIALRVKGGERPSFQIQDSGIGIAEDDIPRIFERFFRSDPSRGRATGGTGLGLSIAKWIVDRHGGYFEVLSREGIGTRISVVLPSKAPPKQEQLEPEP